MTPFSFAIQERDGAARTGEITTAHGRFSTPAFMAVGTRGAIKGVTPEQARQCGCEVVLGNTYHLLLRPGGETVQALGGLQHFSGWRGPMLTDSGGFQVFSLSDLREFDDAHGGGVTFRSHIDGSLVKLTPAESMRVQHLLGADIIMAFDDCPPADCPPERLRLALDRTRRWAEICRTEHEYFTQQHGPNQALFAIVQGGTDPAAREESARALVSLDFPGYAIGGLAVGEGHARMVEAIAHTIPFLPSEKPRYLMGVGYPADILEAVKRGVDMFDCVLPTRNGRNGLAFTYSGARRMRNAKYTLDTRPIEDGCDCYACRHFSRGYVRHLFQVDEMLGPTLVSVHNLRFYQRWMTQIRTAIRAGHLTDLKAPSHEIAEE